MAIDGTTEPDDMRLQWALSSYLAYEKSQKFSPSAVSTFVAEQRVQLARPNGKRDWNAARKFYLNLFGVSATDMSRIEGSRFSGGWRGSGFLYAATSLPMTLAAALPSLYIATIAPALLNNSPVSYALTALLMQCLIALLTPFVNSALQVVSVARQQVMRAQGQPSRGARMMAPDYDAIERQARELLFEMVEYEQALQGHEKRSTEQRQAPGAASSGVALAHNETLLQFTNRLDTLRQQFHVRKQILQLNYTGQFHQSLVRAFRALLTLLGQIISSTTRSPRAGSLTQVAAAVTCAALQLLWAAPTDQYNKWNSMLLGNVITVDLDDVVARHQGSGQWDPNCAELEDLRTQWKRPIHVFVNLFEEWLSTELAVAQKSLASFSACSSSSSENVQRRCLIATSRVRTLEADTACFKSDDWLGMSSSSKVVLLSSIDGEHPWQTATRTAWTRLRQPAEMISQIAQRIGSQFAMVLAGSNMQLIVSALVRYLNAEKTQADQPRVVSRNVMYGVNTGLALLSISMAFSTGAAVNMKIRQRRKLKNQIPGVGFLPSETLRALKAIVQSMFALPNALYFRSRVQSAIHKGFVMSSSLESKVEVVGTNVVGRNTKKCHHI